MIVALCSDPTLRAAVRRAAHPEEDVFSDPALATQALDQGFARAVVYVPEDGDPLIRRIAQLDGDVRPVPVSRATLASWEGVRRSAEVPRPRVDHLAACLAPLLSPGSDPATWVDRTLGDLSRLAGARLPDPLRSVGRRVMEFPARYGALHGLADVAGLTRGALKARFRRRGLSSPSTYVRWFRVLAAAELLSDGDVTTLLAAHRLGFTNGGNLCRTVKTVSGLTPTELRSAAGRQRALVTFAVRCLEPAALRAWSDLDDLFVAGAA